MTHRLAAAAALLVWAAASPAGARLRVESAAGYDSNVERVEEVPGDAAEDARTDGVLRVVLDAAEAARAGRWILQAQYHGGLRRFLDSTGEDAILQGLSVGATHVGEAISLGTFGRARARTTRDPARPRDHVHLEGGPLVAARLGDFTATTRARAERLLYPPDRRYAYNGIGGDLDLAWGTGPWAVSTRGGLAWHRFDGPREARVGFHGVPLVAAVPGTHREDRALSAGLSASWTGPVLITAGYSLYANASDSFGAPQTRHAARVSLDAALPGGILASVRLELQRVMYDDPQYVAADAFVEDEGRSSLLVRLERPLDDTWSVVAHGGAWASPFGSGPTYDRRMALLGVAWRSE